MYFKKNLAVFYSVLASLILCSCASLNGVIITVPEKDITISNDIAMRITSLKDGITSVYSEGKTFTPNNNNAVICEVQIAITNNSSQDLEFSELQGLEMIVINSDDILSFISWTKPFDISATNDYTSMMKKPQKIIKANSIFNDTIYFVHEKEINPVAISYKKVSSVLLLNETDRDFPLVRKFVDKNNSIQTAFSMVKLLPYENIKTFMDDNEVGINDKNIQGLTLLLVGIMYNNNSVVDGSLSNNADMYTQIEYNYSTVQPMHIAVLSCNSYAIDALIKAGINIRENGKNINEPAAIAIKDNNINAVKLLIDRGIDFSTVKISMSWSGSKLAIDYARDRKYNEIVMLLENQIASKK